MVLSNGTECMVVSIYAVENYNSKNVIELFSKTLIIYKDSISQGMQKKDDTIWFSNQEYYQISWLHSFDKAKSNALPAPDKRTVFVSQNSNHGLEKH